jgi:hypothetical protein
MLLESVYTKHKFSVVQLNLCRITKIEAFKLCLMYDRALCCATKFCVPCKQTVRGKLVLKK